MIAIPERPEEVKADMALIDFYTLHRQSNASNFRPGNIIVAFEEKRDPKEKRIDPDHAGIGETFRGTYIQFGSTRYLKRTEHRVWKDGRNEYKSAIKQDYQTTELTELSVAHLEYELNRIMTKLNLHG